MKTVYRNPKELVTKIKDLVEGYFEGIISYEKFEQTAKALIEKNYDRIFKNGDIAPNLFSVIGEEGRKVINEVASKIKQ